MKEINEKEYNNLYYANIVSIAKQCERKKKPFLRYKKILGILAILVYICAFLCFILCPQYINQSIPIVFVIIGIPTFLGTYAHTAYLSCVSELKNEIYPRIFNLLGMEYISEKKNKKDFILYKNALEQLGISSKIDDVVKGEFKGIPFVAIEFGSKYRELLLATNINKTITKDTFIISRRYPETCSNIQEITLEDIEFNNLFKIYAENQIEARFMLTPTFMERLKNYKKTKYTIDVHFMKKSCLNSNIFLFISSGKDFFEIEENESFLNKETYYKFYEEIKDILNIVDALKLDQNIGM